MKNLFKLAITDGLQSLLPILLWYVVGIVYGDTDLFNIFTITYPFQFCYAIIFSIVINGTIKYEKKNQIKNHDYAYSALILAYIIFLILFVGLFINIDSIVQYMGVNIKYTNFILFSYFLLNIDILICGISKIKQYDEDNNKAFKLTTLYYFGRIPILIIIKIIIKDNVLALIITAIVYMLLIITILIKNIHIKKFKINCVQGIKYEIPQIISNIAMFIIYFFGLSRVVTQSESLLIAYNIAAMCTDTQWDILSSAIDTNTSLHICNGTYEQNKKYIIKSNIKYSLCLFASCIIMVILNRLFKPFDLKYALIVVIIECGTFPLYAIKYTVQQWLNLMYSGILIGIIPILIYIIRITVSFTGSSDYTLSIGVLVTSLTGGLLTILLYKVKHKQYFKKKEANI